MNPYAPQLGDRDPYEAIAATPGHLTTLLEALGQHADVAPAPGKWSAREVLCHLADCEIVFAYRLRQALAETYHVIQPFDQEKWAATYAACDAQAALAVYTSVRNWNLKLINTVTPEALSKPLTHPERGEMTFKTLIETMAGHDLNHQRQIEAIVNQSGAASAAQV